MEVVDNTITLCFDVSFNATHKEPGDKQPHEHEYIALIEVEYEMLKRGAETKLGDVVAVVIEGVRDKDLNELFEADTRHAFITPRLETISRHIADGVKDRIISDNPKAVVVTLTEVDLKTLDQRGIIMRVRTSK